MGCIRCIKYWRQRFMIFQLPPEIASAINGEIVATYDVPEITALGVDVKRKTGNFENS